MKLVNLKVVFQRMQLNPLAPSIFQRSNVCTFCIFIKINNSISERYFLKTNKSYVKSGKVVESLVALIKQPNLIHEIVPEHIARSLLFQELSVACSEIEELFPGEAVLRICLLSVYC